MMNTANIKSFDYTEFGNILTITYQGGTVTSYHPVNPETYAEMIRLGCLNQIILNNVVRSKNVVGINRGN